MTSPNPFEPSPATLAIDEGAVLDHQARAGSGVWRDGRVIVMSPGAAMPRRCVKCNCPAHEPTIARTVYWYSPWLFLLLLLNVILFALIALLVRKKTTVAPGLCAEHKKRRHNVLGLAWTGALLGIVVMYVGIASPLGVWGAVIGTLVIVGAIVFGIVFGLIVYPVRIDKTIVRLKGAGQPFLESLPELHGFAVPRK